MAQIYFTADQVRKKLRPFLTEYRAQEATLTRLHKRINRAELEYQQLLFEGKAYYALDNYYRDEADPLERAATLSPTLGRVREFQMLCERSRDGKLLVSESDIYFLDSLSANMVLGHRAKLRLKLQQRKWTIKAEQDYAHVRKAMAEADEKEKAERAAQLRGILTTDRALSDEERRAVASGSPVAEPPLPAAFKIAVAVAAAFVCFLVLVVGK